MSLATAVPMSHRATVSGRRHQRRYRSYFLESPIGVFGIMRDPASPNRWNLYLRSKKVATYESAEEAIHAVEGRNTGLADWDEQGCQERGTAMSDVGLFRWKTI